MEKSELIPGEGFTKTYTKISPDGIFWKLFELCMLTITRILQAKPRETV